MAMKDLLNGRIPIGNLTRFVDHFHRLLGVEFVGHPFIPGVSIFSHAYSDPTNETQHSPDALRLRYRRVVFVSMGHLSKHLDELSLLELDVLLEPSYIAPPSPNTNYGCVPSLLGLVSMTLEHSASNSIAQLSERVAGLRYTRAESRSQALLSGFTTLSYHNLDTFLGDELEYRVACRVLGVSPSEQLLHRAIMGPLSEYITEITDLERHPLAIPNFVAVPSSSSPLGSALVRVHEWDDTDTLPSSDVGGKHPYLCAPLESILILLRRVTHVDKPNHRNSHVAIASGALDALREYIDAVALAHDLFLDRVSTGLFISETNAHVYRALRRTMSENSQSLYYH